MLLIPSMFEVVVAQDVELLQPGARIRVSAAELKEQLPHPSAWERFWGTVADPRSGRFTATVLFASSDSLAMQLEKGDIRTALAWNSIDVLEKASGRGENAAMVGALVGVAAGGASGYLTGKDDCRRIDYQCMSRRSGAVAFGLGGLVLGAGFGALIGEEWVRVPLPIQVSLRGEAAGNLKVSASRRF
jgi:hypothetical protein